MWYTKVVDKGQATQPQPETRVMIDNRCTTCYYYTDRDCNGLDVDDSKVASTLGCYSADEPKPETGRLGIHDVINLGTGYTEHNAR